MPGTHITSHASHAPLSPAHELELLALCRVDEAHLRPAVEVTFGTDVLAVVRLFQAHKTTSVLVRDTSTEPHRLGIFTTTGLQRAILDGQALDQLAVGGLSSFPVIAVQAADPLGDAMAEMLLHRVHRVVVRDGEAVVGILEALDLFSFLSNQSHLITVEIENASDLSGLSQASSRITRMMGWLYRSGSRIELIARLVQQLNARLFERAWQLIAPPDLVANSCLCVMGSEGRGEQLLKTDQDNGLILRDGYTPPADLEAICQRFSGALADFGYPPCPGNIMLSNPQWRRSVSDWGQATRQWVMMPDGQSLMNLAIFMDAHAVCGDAHLLSAVKRGISERMMDNDVMLGHFAAAIDAFGTESHWWSRLLGRGDKDAVLNLKKEGVFPLVHGVRSLALAHQVAETGTGARIAALIKREQLEPEMGRDLKDSLHVFMALKLRNGLLELDQGLPVSGTVNTSTLGTLDRDLLQDAIGVVKRFRAVLRRRFHLDAMG
jgi:CBS domain-containing protein